MLWVILWQGYLPHISPLLQITAKYDSPFIYGEPLIPVKVKPPMKSSYM